MTTTELLKVSYTFVNSYYPNGQLATELKAGIKQAENQQPVIPYWRATLNAKKTASRLGLAV